MARTERMEVRLDGETRGKLEEVAAARGVSISEVVRALIERAHEDELARRRMEAAESLGRLELEDVPDIKTLTRQLEGAYDVPDLY